MAKKKTNGVDGANITLPIPDSKLNGKERPTGDAGRSKACKELAIPDKLANGPVTPASLRKGRFQQQVAAFFAPQVLIKNFRALIKKIEDGDMKAIEQANQIYGLLQKTSGGTTVFVNQTNAQNNQQASVNEVRNPGPNSPDEIFRMLEAEREQRRLGKVVEAEGTPTADYANPLSNQ